jgi:putative DNA methylase
MRSEAQRRIGHLYPDVEITAEMARERTDLRGLIGQRLDVVAWLWARTVKSPNPAFSHVDVPLVSTFSLGGKEGKEAYLEPIVRGDHYEFKVKVGALPEEATLGTKLARGAHFKCLVSNAAIDAKYIRSEAQAGRMGTRLLAIVADGARGKLYLSPSTEHSDIAEHASPKWKPDLKVTTPCHDVDRLPMYGMYTWGDVFTARQLVALTTFNDLVADVRQTILKDAIGAGFVNDGIGLESGGAGAVAYSEAISVYLAAGISQIARYSCMNCAWNKANENVAQAFGRQALPIVWDFAESNPLVGSLSIETTVGWTASGINKAVPRARGVAFQEDARKIDVTGSPVVFSTDPPYYDNIGYAELSEFFYVWLRPALRSIFPGLFATMGVPKAEELVAASYRHGSKQEAEEFFLSGMKEVMQSLALKSHPAFPVTIYYAFKQAETKGGATASTGWETFLEAVLHSGFLLTGTWPMRTEKTEGLKGASNALASCIVLVCRQRPADAPSVSRREFIRELNGVLPDALDEMTKGAGGEHSPVAPVDLSQAIIGPGMAVFSKYSAVLEADGSAMSVRTALRLINRFLAEEDFDPDTQFCLHWFEQYGWTDGPFGDADTLSRGKGTSVNGMKEAGVLQSGGGRVRLLRWAEYPTNWDPRTDARTPVWEALHQLIRALKQGGESSSGELLAALGGRSEAVRQLAYRLYTLCERLGQAEDARAYNELITSWTGIESAAASTPKPTDGLLPGFED